MGARRGFTSLHLLSLCFAFFVWPGEGRPGYIGEFFTQSSLNAYGGSLNGTCGPSVSVETPVCNVTSSAEGYEIRKYYNDEQWVTTIVLNQTFSRAFSIGVARCQSYISGGNSLSKVFPSTAPVLVQPLLNGAYKIGFYISSSLKNTTLPKPNDPSVEVVTVPPTTRAVLGPFGGFPDEGVYQTFSGQLRSLLDTDLVPYDDNSLVFASYSNLFTLFNRKQEVWLKLFG